VSESLKGLAGDALVVELALEFVEFEDFTTETTGEFRVFCRYSMKSDSIV
jgi:hypothetical protein